MSTKELVEHMRHLRVVLKSGEYTGVEIMETWCALAQAADELDRLSSLGGKAMTAAPSEPKCACGQYAIKDAPAGHRTAQCPNLPAALLELAAIRKRHAAETRYYDRVNEPHTDAHADRAALLAHVAELERERDEARDYLMRNGHVRCNIPACNCGSWHHRYGLPERWQEVKDALDEAAHPLTNANGNKVLNALNELAAERDALRTELAEAKREIEVLRQYGNKDCTAMADAALKDTP